MSGTSFGETCPKCGGEMNCYSDYKPYHQESGECLECGFGYRTDEFQATLEEVNESRVNAEMKPLKKLKKQEE